MKQSEAQLRDEITLREASIADARRELAAGDLAPLLAASIESRELLALAKARATLELLEHSRSPQQRKRRRRRWLLVVALLCFFVAAVIFLVHSIGVRQPGNTITGSPTLTTSQRITQLLNNAEVDIANGNVNDALDAYTEVLVLEPKNVSALTQRGWLVFSAGSSDVSPALVTQGVKDLREAIAYAPRDPAPRLYYAIVADSTKGNTALAKKEFRIFLALKPSTAQLAIAKKFLQQLGMATT